MTFRARALYLMMAVTVTMMTSACNNVLRDLEHFPELFNPKVNVTEYNYSAADDLIGQAKENLPLSTPIAVGVLYPTNLKPNEKTPPYGQVCAEQIATRFVSLGYNIRDLGINLQESATMSERSWLEHATEKGAVAILIGNYTVSDYDVLMSVRLVDAKGGRILAASSYRVPLGSDSYRLLNRDPFQALAIPDFDMGPRPRGPGRAPHDLTPSTDLPVRVFND